MASPGAAPEEVLFLVLQALSQGPFAALAKELAEQATAQGLLPRRHDVTGAQHPLSLSELQQHYPHLPPDALHHLLSQLLDRRRQEAPQPAARGLTSLLESGVLSTLGGSGAATSAHLPPAWLRPARRLPSQTHRLLLLRQAGLLPRSNHPATVAPAPDQARQLAHQLTVRGHRFAVYCVCYDRTGQYIITGSDDRLVKIWSARTGLLQSSCRGHDAEITDLAVSADNALLASSSIDCTVRVWELQGASERPGQPVSVLVGHSGTTAFVEFHPTVPDALLSASFDGTCRIWRAREAATPPIVLRVDPVRFGLSGHAVTRLGGLGWQPFSGSGASGGAAAPLANGLLDAGVRTTRNMERQLLGLGMGQAGQQQQQQSGDQGVRQSGRPGRQLRNMSELLGEEEEGDVMEVEEAPVAPRGAAWRVGAGVAAAVAAGADDGESTDEEGAAAGGTSGLLVCGFSRDGTHIVAGGNDCSVYIWQWAVPAVQSDSRAGTGQQAGGAGTPGGNDTPAAAASELAPAPGHGVCGAAAGNVPSTSAASDPAPSDRAQQAQQPPRAHQQQRQGAQQGPAAAQPAEWPAPRELCQLKGHRNDVILLQFSNNGDQVATGSKDGSVRVWRRPRRWRKRPQAWEQEVTFAVLPDPEAIKEARRRRRPPPAPSIDQLSWSADDQRLIVSVTDFGIRVLGMPDGQLLHHLTIHTGHVHILECHPTHPALAFSASYDGTLALWHMRSGEVLRRFSSRQTRPDGRSWPDVIPLADGHFSPDGSSLTVTDVAGQLHLYALGGPCGLLSSAPYDQFLTADYNPLMRDLQHNVVDAETQLPPHLPEAWGALCDALGNPYPESLQHAFRAQRMLSAARQEVAWLEPGKEPGYLLAAPTLTAAQWAVEQVNGTDHAVHTAIARAQERLTIYEDRLNAGAREAVAEEAAAEVARPRSRQRRQQWGDEEVGVAAAMAEEVVELESSGEIYAEESLDGMAESDEEVDFEMLTSEEEDEEEDEEGGAGDGGNRRRSQRSGGRQRRLQRGAAEASRHSSRLAGRRAGGSRNTGTSRAATRRATQAAAPPDGGEGEGAAELQEREERQRLDREARAARRRAAQQEQLAAERHRRQRQAAARRRREADSSDEELEDQVEALVNSQEAGPSRRPSRAEQRSCRRPRAGTEEEESEAGEQAAQAEGRQRKRQRRSYGSGGRALSNYSWLLAMQQSSAVYVPQAGDAVVYLREGHEQYLAATNDKRPPPWATLRHGRDIRPAEPCRVVDVQYVIANDGTDRTQAQLTLSLTDEASPLKDTCFTVEVPSPAAGYAEFVVLASRFWAAVVSKCWEVGEACQVYWNDDEASGNGEWWLGTIVHDQRRGRHADVLEDPYAAGGLWERFDVRWQGVAGEGGELAEERQADNQRHSPWELFPPGFADQTAAEETTALDPLLADRMIAAVQAAGYEERFGIFKEAPPPQEAYVSKNRRREFYNRLVALPLSLQEVEARLASGYYRQPEALVSDLSTIAANAAAFNGEDSELAEDAVALAQYLTAVLQGQEVDLAAYATFPEDLAAAEAAEETPTAGRGRGGVGGGRHSTRRHQRDQQQQQQEQESAELAMPDLQQLLHQNAGLPPPPLPLPLPPPQQPSPQDAAATGAGLGGGAVTGPGRVVASGMRVRFTVPTHLRLAASQALHGVAAAATGAGAGEQGGVQQAAPLEGTVGAARGELQGGGEAAARSLPQPGQEAAGPSAAQSNGGGEGVPVVEPPPGLFADVAAALMAGTMAGEVAAPAEPPRVHGLASETVEAAALPADWFAALPMPAAAGGEHGHSWPGGAAIQQDAQPQRHAARRRGSGACSRHRSVSDDGSDYEEEEEAGSSSESGGGARRRQRGRNTATTHRRHQKQGQEQERQEGRRASRRAVQRRSYRESDGEEAEGQGDVGAGWAPADGAWQQAFQTQQPAPRVPQRQRRKAAPSAAARGDDDGEWVQGMEEEGDGRAPQSAGEESYQPEEESSEPGSEGSWSGGSGSQRKRSKQQSQRQIRSGRRRSRP